MGVWNGWGYMELHFFGLGNFKFRRLKFGKNCSFCGFQGFACKFRPLKIFFGLWKVHTPTKGRPSYRIESRGKPRKLLGRVLGRVLRKFGVLAGVLARVLLPLLSNEPPSQHPRQHPLQHPEFSQHSSQHPPQQFSGFPRFSILYQAAPFAKITF